MAEAPFTLELVKPGDTKALTEIAGTYLRKRLPMEQQFKYVTVPDADLTAAMQRDGLTIPPIYNHILNTAEQCVQHGGIVLGRQQGVILGISAFHILPARQLGDTRNAEQDVGFVALYNNHGSRDLNILLLTATADLLSEKKIDSLAYNPRSTISGMNLSPVLADLSRTPYQLGFEKNMFGFWPFQSHHTYAKPRRESSEFIRGGLNAIYGMLPTGPVRPGGREALLKWEHGLT